MLRSCILGQLRAAGIPRRVLQAGNSFGREHLLFAAGTTSRACVACPQSNALGRPNGQPLARQRPGPEAADVDLITTLNSLEHSEAALARELVAAVKADRLQLQQQVDELSRNCAGLSLQVQRLTKALDGGHSGTGNLMAKDASNRASFRPTIEMVANQPTHVSQLDNKTVMQLGMWNNHSAHKERLLREIMQVDGMSWEDAHQRLNEMDVSNEKGYWMMTLPYRLGIVAATVAAIGSCFMVFHHTVAHEYATRVVGEDTPEGTEDVSHMTINQVGTWSWSWMEPMIGTASFVLLCFQFARAQAWKLNMRPYTESMLRYRADRLVSGYPQYDKSIVRAWAKHMPKVEWNFFPTYRRYLGFRCL